MEGGYLDLWWGVKRLIKGELNERQESHRILNLNPVDNPNPYIRPQLDGTSGSNSNFELNSAWGSLSDSLCFSKIILLHVSGRAANNHIQLSTATTHSLFLYLYCLYVRYVSHPNIHFSLLLLTEY